MTDDKMDYDIPPPPEVREAMTAFLVVIEKDGSIYGHNDVNIPLSLERAASLDDMYRGCVTVAKDTQRLELTQSIIQNMLAVQKQIAEQAQTQALGQQLLGNKTHSLKGIR